jgi:hypothetical protein
MCEWLVSLVPRDKLCNTQQRLMHGIVPSVMPCIARKYLRHRNAMYFYKDLNFYSLIACFLQELMRRCAKLLLFVQAKSKITKRLYFIQ